MCTGEVTAIAGITIVEPRTPDDEIDEEDIDESGEYWEPDCDEKFYYGMVEIGRYPADTLRKTIGCFLD